MSSFRKPPVLHVIPGGRRIIVEQEFELAFKENATALAEAMKARSVTSPELYGKQQRLLHHLRADPTIPVNSTSRPALGAVADIAVADNGSIILVKPQSDAAQRWIRENVDPEARWLGRALVVERRYIADLVAGMQSAGLVVE